MFGLVHVLHSAWHRSGHSMNICGNELTTSSVWKAFPFTLTCEYRKEPLKMTFGSLGLYRY